MASTSMKKTGFSALLIALLVTVVACASESDLGDHAAAGACEPASIEGEYAYTETFAGACSSDHTFETTVSVTVERDEATITGLDTSIRCTLSGCKCTTKAGELTKAGETFQWASDGFDGFYEKMGCSVTATGRKK